MAYPYKTERGMLENIYITNSSFMNLSIHNISISLLLMLVAIHNGNTSFIGQETDQKTTAVDSKI